MKNVSLKKIAYMKNLISQNYLWDKLYIIKKDLNLKMRKKVYLETYLIVSI